MWQRLKAFLGFSGPEVPAGVRLPVGEYIAHKAAEQCWRGVVWQSRPEHLTPEERCAQLESDLAEAWKDISAIKANLEDWKKLLCARTEQQRLDIERLAAELSALTKYVGPPSKA